MLKHSLNRITTAGDLRGRYVLVRTPMNVPIVDGVVQNQFRITRALATLNYLVKAGARVIVMGHIGDGEASAAPIADVLRKHLPHVGFVPAVTGDLVTEARNRLSDGEVLLLENVRSDAREGKNDPSLAAELALLAEVYVNDAFADSHRAHASIVGVPVLLPSYVGQNFIHEYEELAKTLAPKIPALFLLGGAKFSTKMPLVERFLQSYDQVFIGGALANDVFKARGYEVGTSLVGDVDLVGNPILDNLKLLLPVDVVVEGNGVRRTCLPTEVAPHERILDCGPATVAMLGEHIARAATILWNGPFGNYEAGYAEGTEAVAKIIAAATGYAVVGGGDTVAAIEKLGVEERYGFLSTAGGAMLTFLETGTLAGIDAIDAATKARG